MRLLETAGNGYRILQQRVRRAGGVRRTLRSAVLPGLAVALTLGIAVAGSLITGTEPGRVTEGVEGLASRSSDFLVSASTLLPLGFAFAAGMVSAVNPCGFTMLPAYLGLYLGADGGQAGVTAMGRRLARALIVGATVTGGFIALFAVVGTAIGVGAQLLVTLFPWIGLAVGVALVMAGAWMLGGGALYSSLGERLAAGIGDPARASLRGYFLFGLSYGTASLSCTLPIFLTVVGGSIAVSNLPFSVGQLVLYGLGMGSIIMALTLSMAFFKSALVRLLRRVQPHIRTVSSLLLLAAGAYIVYYWLTIGGLLDDLA